MNPEYFTSYALGELSTEDRDLVEKALASDPEAQRETTANMAFCQLLQTELGSDHAALLNEQRENLVWRAGEPAFFDAPEERSQTARARSTWVRRMILPLSAAALLMFMLNRSPEELPPPLPVPGVFKETSSVEQARRVKRSDASQDKLAATPPAPTRPQSESSKPSIQMRSLADATETPSAGAAPTAPLSANANRTEPSTRGVSPAKPQADPSSNKNQRKSEEMDRGKGVVEKESEDKRTLAAASVPLGGEPRSSSAIPEIVLPEFGDAGHDRLPKQRDDLMPATAPSEGGEAYRKIVENALTAVLRQPVSTFSMSVDTAAYANVRRFLNRGSMPPPDAVRVEELINYFPYNLEGPDANSPHPFAISVEIAGCPWQPQHRLARIAIQASRMDQRRLSSNLVFLIDVSGSMNTPDKLPLVKQSLRLLVDQLGDNDRVSIVTYAGDSGLVLPSTIASQKNDILMAIDRLQADGSTNGSAGIQLAYEQALAGFDTEGINRVILFTDGDFNVGLSSPKDLETFVSDKARSRIFLSVLGFGTGNLQDHTMETLATKGNGNYAYLDSLSEARKVLVDQLSGTLTTVAKDVKIQVEFNPAQVSSYRLIGYENRLLSREDFNNETKDAGEIGAGHSVVAFYEIVPSNLPPGAQPPPLVEDLKYQTNPQAADQVRLAGPAASGESMTVKLRYKKPDSDISQLLEAAVTDTRTTLVAASPEFKFAAAAAAYGLQLRQSSYRGTLTWEQIRNLAIEGKGGDPFGYRSEFIQLIDKAHGIQGGR